MIITDRLLQDRAERSDPVRVAMVGAGFMGRGLANQIVNSVAGMELVAIANRTVDHAVRAYKEAGVDDVALVGDASAAARAAAAGRPFVTDDPSLAYGADHVDAVVDATGAVEFGTHVALGTIAAGKHLVLLNAELDGTVGPILKQRADAAGVVYTACDGDQPGVQANLLRFVQGIGVTPLVAGNIKGLQDPYRTPTTQEGFAKQWGQDPWMVTSFADGTKISFEQALVANGFGLTVPQRGMYGRDHRGHVDELTQMYDVDALRELGGIVDYVVGSKPSPGVFVLGTHDDPKQRHYLKLYKLGDGPLYSFYVPYHLCHFEVPNSVARAVLLGEAVLAPDGGPRVEVVTTAKRDLAAGEVLDALGGYLTYGVAERADVQHADRLLPIGLAEGAMLRRPVAKDEVVTYDDVTMPAGRRCDVLRAEQDARFHATGEDTR